MNVATINIVFSIYLVLMTGETNANLFGGHGGHMGHIGHMHMGNHLGGNHIMHHNNHHLSHSTSFHHRHPTNFGHHVNHNGRNTIQHHGKPPVHHHVNHHPGRHPVPPRVNLGHHHGRLHGHQGRHPQRHRPHTGVHHNHNTHHPHRGLNQLFRHRFGKKNPKPTYANAQARQTVIRKAAQEARATAMASPTPENQKRATLLEKILNTAIDIASKILEKPESAGNELPDIPELEEFPELTAQVEAKYPDLTDAVTENSNSTTTTARPQ